MSVSFIQFPLHITIALVNFHTKISFSFRQLWSQQRLVDECALVFFLHEQRAIVVCTGEDH